MGKEFKDCNAGDRISNLPEALLHHILSLLDIKHGARSSVLSKRWNYIWTTVPVLDLPYVRSPQIEKFMDFVDGTLHRHSSSNIDKFSLVCASALNDSRIHSWMSTVVGGNVKELTLKSSQKFSLPIPTSLFTCESLTSLDLGDRYYNSSFICPKYISFPRLKRLKLRKFIFSDECWNQELFSNSPVLEELTLEFCEFRTSNFCISIPMLKLLEINNRDLAIDYGLKDCALEIDAPSLVRFTYEAEPAKEIVLSGFPTLVEAIICLYRERDGAGISRLLRAVAHVKSLTVSDLTLQAICSTDDLSNSLLTFHNVKRLKISDVVSTDEGLVGLLKAVPNLESLVFVEYINDEEEVDSDEYDDSDEDESDDVEGDGVDDNDYEDEEDVSDAAECDTNDDGVDDDDDYEDEEDVSDAAECDTNDEGECNYNSEADIWVPDSMTAGCLFPHLKSICFEHFGGNPREMRWVKLILRNAKALQMMTIHHDTIARFINARSEEEYMAEVPSFPRASAGCVFKFC